MATKHDFEQAARIIRAQLDQWQNESIENRLVVNAALAGVARQLAGEYQRDNPKFDRVRFMTACGF